MLSPIFFLVVMDTLLQRLRETSSGMSICGLYLGGAAHADDVRVLASSAAVAEEQGQIIHSFATENGLKLNCEKTEVVKISQSNHHVNNPLLLADHIVEVIPHAVYLGYHWFHCLSARRGVEMNINKARRQFFHRGSSGCFLGHSNPLSAREVMETCVMPTLLYGAENWILDDACLDLLERFQAEIGRRILRLNRYHSYLAVRIGLSLPSIASRILIKKLGYLLRLSSSKDVSIATNTFKTIACLNAYNLSLVKQCIFLDSKLKTNCTDQILNNMEDASSSLKAMKKTIFSTDQNVMLEEASKHQSVSQASEINWLRVWKQLETKAHTGPRFLSPSISFLPSPSSGKEFVNYVTLTSQSTQVSSAISLKFTPQATLTSVTSWMTSA